MSEAAAWIDLDHTHNRLVAALRAIEGGKGLADVAAVPPFGQQTIIANALNDAATYLNEDFREDTLELVDRVFSKLGLKKSSKRKDHCAEMLLEQMVRRPS